jgi:hypothetical protein
MHPLMPFVQPVLGCKELCSHSFASAFHDHGNHEQDRGNSGHCQKEVPHDSPIVEVFG